MKNRHDNRSTRRFATGLTAIATVLACAGNAQAAAGPAWSLDKSLGTPDWLNLSFQTRARYESLSDQYRASSTGSDQVWLFRTLVEADLRFEHIGFTLEGIDARQAIASDDTPLSGSFINPTDIQQAYVYVPMDGLLQEGSKSNLKAGRFTMDVGDRRLIARNSFRNTINAFTGADWDFVSAGGSELRAFYTMPVVIRYDGEAKDNDALHDKEYSDVKFWGLYYSPAALPTKDRWEAFVFGLDEDDNPPELATANRRITTVGSRAYRPSAKSAWSYDVEGVYQFGHSYSSTSASNTTNLDHKAWFVHAEAGYTFPVAWSPNVLAQYDYATGDKDASDDENNRFDTLYGARRFDFGPTSIYGPFARANINTPGVRVKFKPSPVLTGMAAARAYWLADKHDSWTTAKISSDETYIGSQIEFSLKWDIVPKNVSMEVGAAHLFAGDVMDDANKDDTTFGYAEFTLKL